jgi:4a-hydroxytetrahydrobiopterin dehydratase
MSTTILTTAQIEAAGVTDWRWHVDSLHTRFTTGNFVKGLELVNKIGAAAESANHHPDLDLRYPHVDVHLSSHDAGGVTQRDVDLARKISMIAGDLGIVADPRAAGAQ